MVEQTVNKKLKTLKREMADNAPISILRNVVCVECGKNAGTYQATKPSDGTQTFVCMSHLRKRLGCPSCFSLLYKTSKNEEKSNYKRWQFDCTCASCGRDYEAIVIKEWLDKFDDLKVTKKVKRKKNKKEIK